MSSWIHLRERLSERVIISRPFRGQSLIGASLEERSNKRRLLDDPGAAFAVVRLARPGDLSVKETVELSIF